jgi:GTPase SAR1 family protein
MQSNNVEYGKHSGIFNAGRVLVVGSQGGGKTALATKISAYTGNDAEYQEEFGGTIETEYLKVTYYDGKLFSLLLPIGGQEKWASLRTQYGETAEGIIVILDSLTKAFWLNSLKQAREVSPMIPYEDYPIAGIITKEDQNQLLQKDAPRFADVIINGIQNAIENEFDY